MRLLLAIMEVDEQASTPEMTSVRSPESLAIAPRRVFSFFFFSLLGFHLSDLYVGFKDDHCRSSSQTPASGVVGDCRPGHPTRTGTHSCSLAPRAQRDTTTQVHRYTGTRRTQVRQLSSRRGTLIVGCLVPAHLLLSLNSSPPKKKGDSALSAPSLPTTRTWRRRPLRLWLTR